MQPAYEIEELDNILKASLEFKEIAPNDHFYAGNIGGRQGLGSGIDGTLNKKMKYISGLDINVLDYLGFGSDNIEYFEIGPNAKKFLTDGGFKRYFEKVKQQETIKQVYSWSPIVISIIALLVSVLTWLLPVTNDDKIKDLQKDIDVLKLKQDKIEKDLKDGVRRSNTLKK